MSDYTPTTERVRNSYANDIACFPKPENVFEANARAEAAKEEFDRWLAEHDRQERADERARVLTIIRARFEDLARLERSGRVFDDSVRFVLSHIADVPE